MKSHHRLILSFFTILGPVLGMAQNPGGVSAGLYLWLKAGAGVSQSSGQVSKWTNQAATAMTTQPSATASAAVTLVNNNINFNPALTYDGTQLLQGAYSAAPAQPPLMFAVARGKTGGAVQFVANVYSNSPAGAPGMLYDATTGRYWVDASGTECSNTASALNTAALIRVYYNSTSVSTNGYAALNAVPSGACAGGVLSAADGNIQIGGRTWGFGGTGRIFVGDMAEVIYYNANTASALQINQVESYLALKYGLTLGNTSSTQNYTASDGATIFWTGNSTYQNDIFGIGTDNASGLLQSQSNSMNSGSGAGVGQSGKGNLTLSTSSALANKNFMVIGNDAGALTEQTSNVPSVAAGSKRVTRTWLVRNTGGVGAVNLDVDITGLSLSGGTTASSYRLMVNQSGSSNFTVGTQTFYSLASITGNVLRFTAITLNDNAVFTLISQASAVLPANWVEFTAHRKNSSISVKWTTSEESNVDHYEIQTSTDAVHFTSMGRVSANNRPDFNHYIHSIGDPHSPDLYIRIKRVDRDGNIAYGPTILLQHKTVAAVTLQQNPVSGKSLVLNVTAESHSTLSARIIAPDGRIILQDSRRVSPGSQSVIFDIGHLKPGVYFLQTQLDSKIESTKFLKN